MTDKLIINEDGIDHSYECANGFVQRCVSAVHDVNFADARKLARILNSYYRAGDQLSKDYASIQPRNNPEGDPPYSLSNGEREGA